jgi:hypothetical protein
MRLALGGGAVTHFDTARQVLRESAEDAQTPSHIRKSCWTKRQGPAMKKP